MKINSLIVKLEKGAIVPRSPAHAEVIKRFFEQFDGETMRLELSDVKEKRSEQQNNYYHLYLRLIAKETGNDVETLHAYFKSKFLGKGVREIFGDKVRIPGSTARLSKGEFCEYLANIYQLTEIPLPDTTEHFGYSYH